MVLENNLLTRSAQITAAKSSRIALEGRTLKRCMRGFVGQQHAPPATRPPSLSNQAHQAIFSQDEPPGDPLSLALSEVDVPLFKYTNDNPEKQLRLQAGGARPSRCFFSSPRQRDGDTHACAPGGFT